MRPISETSFSRVFCGALAVSISLFCGGCNKALEHIPDAPDPDEIEPFDPNKLELFFQLSVEQAASMLKNNRDAVIVDIRRPEHFAAAHLAGALNYPAPSETFDQDIMALDPGAKILIYGYSGDYAIDEYYSIDAVNILRMADYRNIYWMPDGYPGWIEAGMPVVDSEGKTVADPPLGPMPEVLPDPAAAPAAP